MFYLKHCRGYIGCLKAESLRFNHLLPKKRIKIKNKNVPYPGLDPQGDKEQGKRHYPLPYHTVASIYKQDGSPFCSGTQQAQGSGRDGLQEFILKRGYTMLEAHPDRGRLRETGHH